MQQVEVEIHVQQYSAHTKEKLEFVHVTNQSTNQAVDRTVQPLDVSITRLHYISFFFPWDIGELVM